VEGEDTGHRVLWRGALVILKRANSVRKMKAMLDTYMCYN